MVARRRVIAGAALALVLALTGCYPDGVEVSATDIEGTWVATGPQGQVGKLVFLPDGTYAGTDIPNGLSHADPEIPPFGSPDWSSVDAISGSWKTDWKERTKKSYVVISIEGISSSTLLDVMEGQNGRRLVWVIGDPDSGREVSFRKEGGLDHAARAHPS